jgi:hypothetical protein
VGVAQDGGTAAEGWEASGRRAPIISSRTERVEDNMSVMFVVSVSMILVLVLFGVALFTPKIKTIRRTGTRPSGGERLHVASLLLIWLMAGGTAFAAQEPAQAAPLAAAPRAAAASLLTNSEVLEMVKAGFAEETILRSFRLNDTRFDTSVAALLEMKNAGVSEKVIQAMLSPKAAKAEEKPAAPSKIPLVPDDVGIFYIKNDQLVDIRPELVGWRSGGVGKALLLRTKGHINGALKGPQSQNIVAAPVEFIIRCPETLEIEEYQLLRLDKKPDRREFRALTGGYIHSSSGLDKNAVEFTFVKIAPRVYRVKLGNLPKGEYGFLPPGGQYGAIGGGASGAMIMQGSMSAGKIYSFRVIE